MFFYRIIVIDGNILSRGIEIRLSVPYDIDVRVNRSPSDRFIKSHHMDVFMPDFLGELRSVPMSESEAKADAIGISN